MHKWTMFVLVCVACLLGLSILFISIPQDKPAEDQVTDIADVPLDVAAAETVYSKNCLMCHGDQLQGGGGPALANIGSTMTYEDIVKKIERGGQLMPSFKKKLSTEEIGNLSKWLSEKK